MSQDLCEPMIFINLNGIQNSLPKMGMVFDRILRLDS